MQIVFYYITMQNVKKKHLCSLFLWLSHEHTSMNVFIYVLLYKFAVFIETSTYNLNIFHVCQPDIGCNARHIRTD